MKILLATPLYPPEIGGPATYTVELAKRLAPQHEITIVTYANKALPVPGTTLFSVNKQDRLPVRLLRFFRIILREARTHDVIYVQNAMAAGLPVALASMLTGKPFVLKFVGDEAWERASQMHATDKLLADFLAQPEGPFKIRLMMRIQGFVLRRAKIVTTPSAYLGELLVKTYGVHPDRARTNYNAHEEDVVTGIEDEETTAPHQIVTTARLVVWKGIPGIIRAVGKLVTAYPDIKLLVAGDGPEEESLRALVADLHLEEHVQLLGRVSRAQTWHLRKTSAVYVLNSTYEGLPHTALTSFSSGIPVIATDISGTNEAVYDGQSGLLVPPGDDDALAAAITRLFEDPALGKKLVEGGTKILHEKFSWPAHIKTLEAFLSEATR